MSQTVQQLCLVRIDAFLAYQFRQALSKRLHGLPAVHFFGRPVPGRDHILRIGSDNGVVHVGDQVGLVTQGCVGVGQFARPLQLIPRPAQIAGDCAQLFQARGDDLHGL